MKRTKIVCTVGPASQSRSKIEKMLRAGMNVARLNFSHGKHSDHKALMNTIRAASRKLGVPVAILQDLQGPKIRTGDLPEKGIKLKNGETIVLTTNLKDKKKIPITYSKFHLDVRRGDQILIDDGLMEITITGIRGKDVSCKVVNGGVLLSHKGINLPDTPISISAITKKDREDLEFGIKNGVDYVALSFVRSGRDVKELKNLIKKHEKRFKVNVPTKVFVKIEKKEAIENFDEILAETDGVMVARGDLGVETPASNVPVIQKEIIQKCRDKAKTVVVATQMLDSMIRNPRPTRAEVSDVANAVVDHTDAVMLSGESAYGKYPVESVQIMAKTIINIEASIYDDVSLFDVCDEELHRNEAISATSILLANAVNAKLILVSSEGGYTARMVSSFRPEFPLLVATYDEKVRRQINAVWGAIPFVIKKSKKPEETFKSAVAYLKRNKYVKKGDKIVVVAIQAPEIRNAQNWVKILKIE